MGINSSTLRHGICVSWDHYFLGSCANDEDHIDVDEIDEIDDHDIDDDDDVLVEDGNPSWCTRSVNDTTMPPEFCTRCVEVWSNMTCQRVFTNKACCACREHVYPWCLGKDWSLKLSCLFLKMANELEESMGTDECVHDVCIYAASRDDFIHSNKLHFLYPKSFLITRWVPKRIPNKQQHSHGGACVASSDIGKCVAGPYSWHPGANKQHSLGQNTAVILQLSFWHVFEMFWQNLRTFWIWAASGNTTMPPIHNHYK